MTWIDYDDESVQMKCDWCGKETWWINDSLEKTDMDKKLAGWSGIDTFEIIDGILDELCQRHMCPDCYEKRLRKPQEPESERLLQTNEIMCSCGDHIELQRIVKGSEHMIGECLGCNRWYEVRPWADTAKDTNGLKRKVIKEE